MSVRRSFVLLSVFLLLVSAAVAKNKNRKKQILPDYVLDAQRVSVVIHPEVGEPLTNPTANRDAREEVEKAIMAWGRFDLVMEGMPADLIIVVRKGYAGGPTITHSPTDAPPVSSQGIGAETRVGVKVGRPPDLSQPGPGPADRTGSQISQQIGPSQDTLGVYRGGTDYPLDASPVWRFTAKDALKGPEVRAVKEFEKAITESEKQRKKRP
jgi:hypothetical protein